MVIKTIINSKIVYFDIYKMLKRKRKSLGFGMILDNHPIHFFF